MNCVETLNRDAGVADVLGMALAHHLTVAPPLLPEHDASDLLPGPNSVLAHLAERTAAVGEAPGALVLLGLRRSDAPGPVGTGVLAAAAAVVARSMRGDDWLGRCGPDVLAVLVGSGAQGAQTAAVRVAGAITALDVPGLAACAGVVGLTEGVPARETMRRASEALEAARAAGPGAVVLAH